MDDAPVTKTDLKHLEELVLQVAAGLGREIENVRRDIAALNTRFDTQAQRLARQGALLQTCSRWTSRMNGWAESVDHALEVKDQEIADLRLRLDKLETPPEPSAD